MINEWIEEKSQRIALELDIDRCSRSREVIQKDIIHANKKSHP